MKEIITKHQVSEMGYGYGYLNDVKGTSLKEVLNFYINNNSYINKLTIYNKDNSIYKDYSFYYGHIDYFYESLKTEELNKIVKEIKFKYCHNQKDIDIYLEK